MKHLRLQRKTEVYDVYYDDMETFVKWYKDIIKTKIERGTYIKILKTEARKKK